VKRLLLSASFAAVGLFGAFGAAAHAQQQEDPPPDHETGLQEPEPGETEPDAHHADHHASHKPEPVNWLAWHKGKDLHGGTLDPGEEPMNPAFLFVLGNFVLFAIILAWKAGPKFRAHFAGRHNEIKDALAEAGRLRAEARAKLDEVSRKLAGVEGQ